MRKKNLGSGERLVRAVVGGALFVWALLILYEGGGIISSLLAVALGALGLDFVVTGIRGYCPLYRRLGWSTARHSGVG